MKNKFWKWLLAPILAFIMTACGAVELLEYIEFEDTTQTEQSEVVEETDDQSAAVVAGEAYDTPEEVALYIELYDELPTNYLTKDEARDLGWVASEGNLWDVAPGASIGGDYFGNFEGLLPEDADYTEADIGYEGGRRNAKRLVFSYEGSYYYTDDHYESFEEIEVGDDSE